MGIIDIMFVEIKLVKYYIVEVYFGVFEYIFSFDFKFGLSWEVSVFEFGVYKIY